jgi:hypothetical protein
MYWRLYQHGYSFVLPVEDVEKLGVRYKLRSMKIMMYGGYAVSMCSLQLATKHVFRYFHSSRWLKLFCGDQKLCEEQFLAQVLKMLQPLVRINNCLYFSGLIFLAKSICARTLDANIVETAQILCGLRRGHWRTQNMTKLATARSTLKRIEMKPPNTPSTSNMDKLVM